MSTRTLVFLFLSLVCGGFGYADSAPSLLQTGLAAYQNKQYAEARDAFQKLLESEHPTPGLLNNLALAEYQLDQKPMALALWRKALSLQPSFRPAREGRALLESKMQMRPLESDSLSLWVHRNLEMVSVIDLSALSALLLALIGWMWLRYAARRMVAIEDEQPMPDFPTGATIWSVLFAALLVLTALKVKDGFYGRATVTAAKASVRSLPTDEGVGLFDLSGGAEVLVRRHENGWTQVQSGDGSSGWIKDAELLVTSER